MQAGISNKKLLFFNFSNQIYVLLSQKHFYVEKTETNNYRSYMWLAVLLEAILFLTLWLTNEYLATLLTLVVSVICGGILIVALISELIEKSKVSRFFFLAIGLLAFVPILIAVFFMVLNGGLGWQ